MEGHYQIPITSNQRKKLNTISNTRGRFDGICRLSMDIDSYNISTHPTNRLQNGTLGLHIIIHIITIYI
jgi:hypothetical protein